MNLAEVKYWRELGVFSASSGVLSTGTTSIAETSTVACIDWLIAEVERLTEGYVDGVYMGACYCRDGHICSPCWIREQITVKRITAERDRYKAVLEWKPIETAPTDGAQFLCFRGGDIACARWEGDRLGGRGWEYAKWSFPTHWMPLPDPPSAEAVTP